MELKELKELVDQVVEEALVFTPWDKGKINFMIGQVMKETKSQACNGYISI